MASLVGNDGIINRQVLYDNSWDVIKNGHPKRTLSSKEFDEKYKKTFDIRFNELYDWYIANPKKNNIRLHDLGNLKSIVLGRSFKYCEWIDHYRFKDT